ncbi:MAG: phosphatidate cytidylyltransferase [Bacteroidales bacterium]|nr:phosphatidate cytidylyltransferase [Bacteroidales bacterium]
MSNFLRRTLTAVWIVVFVLGGFWLHPVSFFLTGLIIVAGTQYEYYSMIKSAGIHPQTAGGIIAGLAIFIISALVAAGKLQGKYFLALIPLLLALMIGELFRKDEKPFDSLAHTFLSLIYIAAPFSLFPFAAFSMTGLKSLIGHPDIVFSPGIIVGFFLVLWANDTGAYLTGVSFGRHRLMERISPKKSWEGFLGGIVSALFAAWLLGNWFGVLTKSQWMAAAVIISVAGTLGDLFESMLKRSIGVKDSGSIMPGHGGFLDRFDSALFAFPLLYLFLSLFG